MNVISKILWLRERIREQQEWIKSHGGDIAGYRARYGDKDCAPLDKNGNCRTFSIPVEKQKPELIEGLRPVPDCDNVFYVPMYGNGGSEIWNADIMAYNKLVDELVDLESKNFSAARDADAADPRAVVLNDMKNYNPARDLNYFGSLVRNGLTSPRPSNGEEAAQKIADVLLDKMGMLDESAQRGVAAFVDLLVRGEFKRISELVGNK